MSPPSTCTACGLECRRRRIEESTTIYDCTQCDYDDSLLRLLPGALYEFAVFGAIGLAKLPWRLTRWLYRWVVS